MTTIILYVINALCAIIVMTTINFSRAYTSYKLGDIAIKNTGGVSLNPKKHFEILGFIFFTFLSYGWAAPLDISPFYYKNRKKGNIIVCVVPLLMCLVLSALSLAFLPLVNTWSMLGTMFFYTLSIYFVNFFVLNLIPVYPLYGYKLLHTLLPPNKAMAYAQYEKILQIIVILLLISGVFFNILGYISSSISNIIISVMSIFLGNL